MRFGVLAIWILLFSSLQARAEIVRARFVGTITQLAPDAPHPFSIGEAIWGAYAFDSLSPAVEDPYADEQYPALRYFTIESATGFYARINWGTIMIEDYPNDASPAGSDRLRVVTIPPLVMAKNPFADGTNSVNTVEDVGTIAFDLESVESMIAQSQSLGFPGPAGAFLNDSPLWIHLAFSSPGWLSGAGLPNEIPPAAMVDQSFGEFHFGPAFSSNHPIVRFSISELSVVPEPSAMATIVMGWLVNMRWSISSIRRKT